ncbi:hypothetical protein BDN71DRAFT_1431946 [Pleurotus eryngii]|uniref:Uncharacterized protein n=1 Tax=Pleurotus eryngii TaxID=5323 RepID=A0A9P6DFT3_PLEER|nr:hypothetical protein BDN71DRAFT_1431946 [Pleurotus eryngii]
MSARYPAYSHTYSPPPPFSALDFYNQFYRDHSHSDLTLTQSSPYASPNLAGRYLSRGASIAKKVPADKLLEEKGAEKAGMKEIPLDSPTIIHALPPHYRHNDFECQHGHRQGGGGACPYAYPSHNLRPYGDGFDSDGPDADKRCHSDRLRRILLPILVVLIIIVGIFTLNACLVSSGVMASWGDWDWKGVGEWKGIVGEHQGGVLATSAHNGTHMGTIAVPAVINQATKT